MNAERVVAAALDELDDAGLDALTMRRVAARLGVQLNTVYWHASGKPALLDLMADTLLSGCVRTPLPPAWPDRLRVLAGRLHDALLSRRDGARLLDPVRPAGPRARALSDALAGAAAAAGLDRDAAAAAARLVTYAVIGIAREHGPGRTSDDDDRLAFALDVLVDGIAARVPATAARRADDDLARRLRPPPAATRRPRADGRPDPLSRRATEG
ncbi:TetR family transcriptional regulator [Pseudonocardia sp. KRD-291]|nr:TetR family transcriptional regulator [Pseudonocardia sp. KRD291]